MQADPSQLQPDRRESQFSRADRQLDRLGGPQPFLLHPAHFTQSRANFEEFELAADQAAIMYELVANRAARPPTPKEGDVPVQTLAADPAGLGFDPQEHRLPVATSHPYTHGRQYSQATGTRQGVKPVRRKG